MTRNGPKPSNGIKSKRIPYGFIWISSEFLNWYLDGVGLSYSEEKDKDLERPYEILGHAEAKLRSNADDLDRVDAIANMKRALYHRRNRLVKIYDLRRLPIPCRSSDPMHFLVSVGIMRDLMFQQLVQLRNLVEHEHRPPPPVKKCRELAEFVWYFLRSTDVLVAILPHSIDLAKDEPLDGPYSISIETGPDENWQIKLSGILPGDQLSGSERQGWLKIRLEKKMRMPKAKKYEDDRHFVGNVMGPSSRFKELIDFYFVIARRSL